MKIRTAKFDQSALSLDMCPVSALPEFAFIGRSNVGKSSLLNLLTNHGGLARVSNTPGRTREMNFFTINGEWTLVDLPGYGYARGPKDDKERFNEFVSDYLVERPNLFCAFVLIDSRHEPQRKDLDFVQWMVESSIPFALVYTKADKVKPKVVTRHIGLFKEAMAEWSEGVPEIFVTSAKTKDGRVELLKFIGVAISQGKG
ncbi:MAG: ribosome biogenesis GTP-binding protein YihA/YsxC [Verrucomicrobiales bacterium]|nr:ribosome biogenesis GTP-binding protein YihA/YsxC [Verrucomicrobiales bacterium]